jgi:hypothetical protein
MSGWSNTTNFTTLNGTTAQYPILIQEDPDTTPSYRMSIDPDGDALQSTAEKPNQYWFVINGTDNANAVADNTTRVISEGRWSQSFSDIENESARMKDNAAVLVDSLTSQYNYSELNITEILSASDLAATWSTNLNSTGYYSWSAAELSTLGINGSTGQSFLIEYEPEYDGQTATFEPNTSTYNGSTLNMSGTMFTDWKPAKTNGSFVAGETYTIPEDKTVIFAWQKTANQSVRVRLDGNVTIRSLTNVQTGESINETTLESEQRAEFTTNFNKSWLEDILEYQQNVRDDAEASNPSTGGGFDFGGIGTFGAGVLGLMAIGLLYVAGQIAGK